MNLVAADNKSEGLHHLHDGLINLITRAHFAQAGYHPSHDKQWASSVKFTIIKPADTSWGATRKVYIRF